MPQENQVLRCFSCGTFQVHIVKKAKKWECKICGAKQSFKRHYGRGSGKDCRNHVMKLNELRFTNSHFKSLPEEIPETETAEEMPPESEPAPVVKGSVSKWASYLDENIDSDNEDFRNKKRRKTHEEYDEVKNTCKELINIADNLNSDQSNSAGNSKQSGCLGVEENTTISKKSKNIFDTSLDNIDDFLNFI